MIVDAAEGLLAERDPLLVTFDQVAVAAGVSRALVHAYLGDRRGLHDAVQVRIVARLDAWVGHGFGRARTRDERLRALVDGLFAFVAAEHEAWSVLVVSGGLDHPALHGARARWAAGLSVDDDPADVPAQAVVAALVAGVGSWVSRGVEPADLIGPFARLLRPDGPDGPDRTT
jgi:AcrR family transcriptional regulator